ncbi:iron-containing alcohol dehydrogenase [Neobacillus drentensis]|uniref:iron-containing alcohol dehydrogenase n=1 Tax=Neobacillus drentensis TaxID=220684 RepID=UPI002FFEC014
MNFSFYSPVRIHFGNGVRKRVGERVKKYGKRCLIVRTSVKDENREKQFIEVIECLESSGIEYIIFDGVKPNPTKDIIDAGKTRASDENVDFIIAYGGGSSMDAAKAIALLAYNQDFSWDYCFNEFSDPFSDRDETVRALPVITITTTSGTGSHITQAAVVTDSEKKEKLTLFHSSLVPKESFVDPELMITVPQKATAATGFDAMCHAMESFFNPRSTRFTELLSKEAITIIAETLPLLLKDLANIVYRKKLAYADTLAGICLSNAGAEAPHPIAETINGFLPELSHGETLAFVYPNYLKHASNVIPSKVETVLQLLNEYIPPVEQKAFNEKAQKTMENFLQVIGLFKPFTLQGDHQALINEMKEKLFFNLPLTDSKQMKNILVESFN